MFQHCAEVGDAASRECLDRTSADRVDANVSWSEILCEIASAGFECCFGDAHHVVTSYDFFRAVIDIETMLPPSVINGAAARASCGRE